MTATTADVCTSPNPKSLSGYKHYRCRCTGCRAADAAHQRVRKKKLAYGQWRPYVDAAAARAHIYALQAAGIGFRRVAELSGVSGHTIGSILGHRRGRRPNKRVRPTVEAAILAVRISPDAVADGACVDATGSRRRTQALMAIGWSIAAQARRLGRDPNNHTEILTAPVVRASTARAIRDLYEELWETPPAASGSKTATLRYARDHGFAVPQSWDDIDDPAATPVVPVEPDDQPDEVLVAQAVAGRVRYGQITRDVDRTAIIRAFHERGITFATGARMLGCSHETVRLLTRAAGL